MRKLLLTLTGLAAGVTIAIMLSARAEPVDPTIEAEGHSRD